MSVVTLYPERPRIDVSACLDGYRVYLFGRPFQDFATLSNAARCANALAELDALGVLLDPQGEVRRMLTLAREASRDHALSTSAARVMRAAPNHGAT